MLGVLLGLLAAGGVVALTSRGIYRFTTNWWAMGFYGFGGLALVVNTRCTAIARLPRWSRLSCWRSRKPRPLPPAGAPPVATPPPK